MILKRIDNRADHIARLEGFLRAYPPRPIAERIEKEIDSLTKGSEGEREVAHWLNRRYNNDDLYAVIHDLQFSFDGVVVQFDHIVIHRHTCMVYVFETKHAPAGLKRDEDGQWYAGAGNKPVTSPLNQARSAAETLRRWLDKNYPGLIIEVRSVLVVTRATNIEAPRHLYIRSDEFEDYAEQVFGDWSLFGLLYRLLRCRFKGFTQAKMKEIGEALVAGHKPFRPKDPAIAYGWRPSEIPPQAVQARTKDEWDGDVPVAPGIVLKKNTRGYAIRHHEAQIARDVIDEIGRRHGQWNDHWRNWIIPPEAAGRVANAIRARIS